MTRARDLAAFVAAAGWGDATRAPLAGDASRRRYERLAGRAGTAVLMDADPASGEKPAAFVAVAQWLAKSGFSAPGILAADADAGFVLLEDLGDALFATVAARDPALEVPLYAAAVDVLAELHALPVPSELPAWDAAVMGPLAGLALDWYASSADDGALGAEVSRLVASLPGAPVPVLRDYHAENLLWLPERDGIARVGLLDFQDAARGPAGYDLASLLADARRDVSAAARASARTRYLDRTGTDAGTLDRALAILGAQRALRILGVFARLAVRDGKTQYLDLMPHVWSQLQTALARPELAGLAAIVARSLPPPTPPHLAAIRAR